MVRGIREASSVDGNIVCNMVVIHILLGHSLTRENVHLRLDVKDANARIEELTKGIIKLALALIE